MKKRIISVFFTAIILLLLLAGCGSASKDAYSASSVTVEEGYYETDYNDYATADAEEAYENSDSGAEQVETKDTSRKLITTVSMSVQTKAFDTFVAAMQENLNSFGGYIEHSELNYDSESNRMADYTIRVPADKLSEFIGEFNENGTITSRTEDVKDVTLEYVDVQSHVSALRTEEEALLKILASAETVEDTITVQSRLSEVRYEIESYESQIRTYDNLVDYATVDLYLREVDREASALEKTTVWSKIGTNLSENLYNIGEFFKNLFVFLVSSAPVFLAIGLCTAPIAIFAIILPIKRHKKKVALKKQELTEKQNM